MATQHSINRKIIKLLKSICDEGSFYLRKKTGHPIAVATYGGHQRFLVLSGTPSRNYPRSMQFALKRFIRSLPINQDEALQQIRL